MGVILVIVYLVFLCSFTENKRQEYFDRNSTETGLVFLNLLKHSGRENPKIVSPQQGNIKDTVFENFQINASEDLLQKIEVHSVGITRSGGKRPRSLEDLRREQKIALNKEVEMDETMYPAFDERAKEDSFEVTGPEAHPYAVMVIISDERVKTESICSGSVLSFLWVLTAAHCFDHLNSIDNVSVYAGGSSRFDDIQQQYTTLVKAQAYHTHPSYVRKDDDGAAFYDVALVKVEKAFPLTKTVNTIALPKPPLTHDDYKSCLYTGFGVFDPEAIYPENKRKTHYIEVVSSCPCLTGSDSDLVMCSRPTEHCGFFTGDTGSGLVCNGKLVAIASFMMKSNGTDDGCAYRKVKKCGLNDTIPVFHKIDPYLSWINSTIWITINRAERSFLTVILVVVFILTIVFQNFV